MGDITEEIIREIDERRARNVGRADRELLEHLLIAAQRERVAAVGYDTARLGERLARSPLPEAAKTLIARAIGQIWHDETMHARYVLGALMRQRTLATQLGAVMQSVEGGVGGWMTAIEQHATWRDAPGERLAAALVDVGGRLSGRIPESVRASLVYGPLRGWCAFSLDSEESAVLSFQRMRALTVEVRAMPDAELSLPDGFDRELERMERDEAAHARTFGALARLLGDDDGFAEGVDLATLEAALTLEQPSATFSGHDATTPVERPFARGGTVVVARGETHDDKLATFDRALDDAGLFALLDARARHLGKRPEALSIVVKIDLMLAWHTSDPSSYVDPALVARLAERLRERGYRDIVVCDAQNVYSRFYANRDVASVARYVGMTSDLYRVVDLSLDEVPHDFSRSMGVYAVGRAWRDADVRVSFAKLKTHPLAVGQLALRNVGTVIPQTGEHFATDRLVEFTALMVGVLHDMPPDFALVDGYAYAADGLMGVLADPTPKHPKLIVAGPDALSVDFVTMRLMGERDPARSCDLRACFEWFGDPCPQVSVQGDLTPIEGWDRADEGLLAAPMAALAGPTYAAFSRRGALLAADMDPVAFPPIGETASLAAARRFVRALLGMGKRPDAR